MEATRVNCSASVGVDGGEFALRRARNGAQAIESIDSNTLWFIAFMRL